jgi:hypothetical protein
LYILELFAAFRPPRKMQSYRIHVPCSLLSGERPPRPHKHRKPVGGIRSRNAEQYVRGDRLRTTKSDICVTDDIKRMRQAGAPRQSREGARTAARRDRGRHISPLNRHRNATRQHLRGKVKLTVSGASVAVRHRQRVVRGTGAARPVFRRRSSAAQLVKRRPCSV